MRLSGYLALWAFIYFLFPTFSFANTTDSGYRMFTSCSEVEDVFRTYIPTSVPYPVLYDQGQSLLVKRAEATTISPTSVSETNVQVAGLDESDIVKTDGKYIYSYQTGEDGIVILDAKNLNTIKVIKIPKNYTGVTFYITKTQLVVVSTKNIFQGSGVSGKMPFWYSTEQRTVVSLYDIRNPQYAALVREVEVDGTLFDSRLTDTGIFSLVVSNSYAYPYVYMRTIHTDSAAVTPKIDDIIPRVSDRVFVQGRGIQKVNLKKNDCSRMGAILDQTGTLQNNFPTLTTIVRFDVSALDTPITRDMIFAPPGQIHVTQDSLYVISQEWKEQSTEDSHTSCSRNAQCMTMKIWNPQTPVSHVYRFATNNANIRYIYNTVVSGSLLNQYSFSEGEGSVFRFVTHEYAFSGGENQSSTRVSILSSTGVLLDSLGGIATGENFQSARFIGNRLYLVTFEQIDPLFVLDIGDSKNIRILGELKMPGYSTYLHPYDTNRLIGIGHATKTNLWGGTMNAGIKIDLYNVADVKNPKQEATLTLGDVGSSSEILSNPRTFVWYKEKNLLLMPATIMISAGDKENPYLAKSAFQGLLGISIIPSGITEKFRITHFPNLPTLKESICTTSRYQYMPEYCKTNDGLSEYITGNLWSYSMYFINRALYIGDTIYTLGDSKIQMQNIADIYSPLFIRNFSTRPHNIYPNIMY